MNYLKIRNRTLRQNKPCGISFDAPVRGAKVMGTDYPRVMTPWYQPPKNITEAVSEGAAEDSGNAGESALAQTFSAAQSRLAKELLGYIHAQTPEFFEHLIIDVLLALGYGDRRRDLATRLGRSGDGGVDGIVAQDELGLDVIYFQAKRLKPGTAVAVSDVRDFAGSLDAHHAVKGIFVATGHFSEAAQAFVNQVSRRLVLIDGEGLCQLMIRHNIGVRVKESYQIKRIDIDYFSGAAAASRMRETAWASIQPRK
jgi:restriction system protein